MHTGVIKADNRIGEDNMTHTKLKNTNAPAKKSLLREMAKYKSIYLMLIPAVVLYITFCYVPMFGVAIAFQDFKVSRGIFGSEFVGFENFISFFKSYNFWQLLRNTLSISILQIVLGFPAPIVLALMLNEVKKIKFKKAVQTITYMPHFISTVVVTSMILDFVSSEGLINTVRESLGLETILFMLDPKYFQMVYVISGIWQGIGWASIIYISALSSIDQELYEAATIDGAGRWKQMLHVTLPGIVPTITIMLIMQLGHLMSVGYDKIILMYNESIYETADVISTFVYRRGLMRGDYSYSTAVGLFNSVINLILLLASNTLSKKLTGSGLW